MKSGDGRFARMMVAILLCSWPAAAREAKGTITYETKGVPIVVAVKYAYLMVGPDTVSGKTVRRIVVSTVDVLTALRKCEAMFCADGGIEEGMTIDLDAGDRVNYWFVANGQRVQYSGTADISTLALTSNAGQRVAGSWNLDARKSGGPQIRIEFDAALVKELTKQK